MTIKSVPFASLTLTELYEMLRLREEVFVLEQECLYIDIDGIDTRSWHTFMQKDGRIIACARTFMRNEEEKTAQIGRVVAAKSERRKGYTSHIMHRAMTVARKELSAERIYLEAQQYAIPFYEQLGFKVISDIFMEDGIPHVKMMHECSTKQH